MTRQEEESDTAGKEGYGKKTDGSKIGGDMGQDGERRKTYSAAVIDGFKRNSAIYVGDSIVRKTDSRLNKGEDVVVCLPGARIEHVTARVEKIMGRGKGGTIPVSLLQRAAGGELAGMSGVGRRFCQQSPASGPLLSKPIM